MARDQSIVIDVEIRRCAELQNISELRLGACRAEIAPAVKYVQLAHRSGRIAFAHGDPPVKGPGRQPQPRQRADETSGMQYRIFVAGTGSAAGSRRMKRARSR